MPASESCRRRRGGGITHGMTKRLERWPGGGRENARASAGSCESRKFFEGKDHVQFSPALLSRVPAVRRRGPELARMRARAWLLTAGALSVGSPVLCPRSRSKCAIRKGERGADVHGWYRGNDVQTVKGRQFVDHQRRYALDSGGREGSPIAHPVTPKVGTESFDWNVHVAHMRAAQRRKSDARRVADPSSCRRNRNEMA